MKIKGLDFLRGVAILLVLFRHGPMKGILHDMGWIGVDLFFVLSGFLVSGLIFKEYQKTNTVKVGTFLIRRGFKIYPSFYAFTFVSIIFAYIWYQTTYRFGLISAEVFYLQSYLTHIHISPHTWSLAVEEHFYFTLALITFLIIKFKIHLKKEFILYSMIGLLLIVFIIRYIECYPHRENIYFIFATHLRIDGILVGVALSYLFHFTAYCQSILKYKWIIIPLAIIFIFPVFIYRPGSFFLNTIGLTTLNIGLGMIVLLVLDRSFLKSFLLFFPIRVIHRLFCFIGIHSYSIYLWHVIVLMIIMDAFELDSSLTTAFYILFSLLIGIILSYLIEKPFLRWRDSIYPRDLDH